MYSYHLCDAGYGAWVESVRAGQYFG
ncbi:MAG: hypothetical protein RL181_1448, partial [Bacteroidota bacterium]